MKKFEFRRISPTDADFVHLVRNASRDFLHDDSKFSLDDVKAWIESSSPDWQMISLGSETIGYFRLSNWSKRDRSIYVGADLHPAHRGKGLAQSAYKEFLSGLFRERKLSKVHLEVLSSNPRAIHVYEKLGFFNEGRKAESVMRRNGSWCDSIVMTLTRSRFMAMNEECGASSSPCIGVCKKNTSSCLACKRTLEEVTQWSKYENEERRSILSSLDSRKQYQ